MANRANLVVDNKIAIGGYTFLADDITVDDGAVITITFPAKTIFTVMTQTTGTSVTKAKSIDSQGMGTVTLTAAGDGTISFIIVASANTTVDALDIGTDATYSITPVRA
jgi:hypothetical protein